MLRSTGTNNPKMIHTHPAVAPLIIGASTALTTILGQLGGNTTITLGEAGAVFVFVTAIVAWISRKLQKIEDNQDRTNEEIKALKEHVASRPCQSGSCVAPAKKN